MKRLGLRDSVLTEELLRVNYLTVVDTRQVLITMGRAEIAGEVHNKTVVYLDEARFINSCLLLNATVYQKAG